MRKDDKEDAPLDPVALTLAIWLGLMVGMTGLVRFAERAQADAQQAAAKPRALVAMQWTPYGS